VYELTDWGRGLESILLGLGDWGAQIGLPPAPVTLSATSVLLYLRGSANPDPEAPPATFRLELDDRVWAVRTEAGRLQVQQGEPADPDASLCTDSTTFNALLETPAKLDAAISERNVLAAGDVSALRRLLEAVGPT
jgi:hypothetical protein